jgi:hypothetical protein
MTHAQLLRGRTGPGLEFTPCDGDLFSQWIRSDPQYGTGPRTEHTIEGMKCGKCLVWIVFDITAQKVLNIYQQAPAPQLARELAAAGRADV